MQRHVDEHEDTQNCQLRCNQCRETGHNIFKSMVNISKQSNLVLNQIAQSITHETQEEDGNLNSTFGANGSECFWRTRCSVWTLFGYHACIQKQTAHYVKRWREHSQCTIALCGHYSVTERKSNSRQQQDVKRWRKHSQCTIVCTTADNNIMLNDGEIVEETTGSKHR